MVRSRGCRAFDGAFASCSMMPFQVQAIPGTIQSSAFAFLARWKRSVAFDSSSIAYSTV